MATISTHYDNLQVKRNASPEVIRAAYKGLTQRYHPDRNPDDRQRCERIMKLINRAYEVLSDPDKRAEYDAFVAREERAAQSQPQRVTSEQPKSSTSNNDEAVLKRIWQEVYAKFPYLNSASEQHDDIAVIALLELMRQYMESGETTASALRRASALVGSTFDLIYEAERKYGRIPLAYGYWNASEDKTKDAVRKELCAKYPFFDATSRIGDQVAIAAVEGLYEKYLKDGWFQGSACHRAGEEVGSRFSLLHQDQANNASTPPQPKRASETSPPSKQRERSNRKSTEISVALISLSLALLRAGSSAFLIVAFPVAIYFGWSGIQALRGRLTTSEDRGEVAILLSMAAAVGYTACSIFLAQTNQTLSSSAELVTAGAALWFVGTYLPMRAAVGSLINATPILGLHQPLIWRGAFLVLLMSEVAAIIGTAIAEPIGFHNLLSSKDFPQPTSPAVLLAAGVLAVALMLVLFGAIIAIAAIFARAFDARITNRPAWALILLFLFGLGGTVFYAALPMAASTASTASARAPATSTADSITPVAQTPQPQSYSTNSRPANALGSPETQRLMEEVAIKWYRLYPFLDNKSSQANETAIYAVLDMRDRLIRDGQDPVSALDAAIRVTGPRFAPQQRVSEVLVTSVTLGKAIRADGKVATPTDTFGAKDTIYAVIASKTSNPNTVVTARWTYQGGQLVKEDTQTLAGVGSNLTTLHISKPDDWPVGNYALELIVGGQPISKSAFVVR